MVENTKIGIMVSSDELAENMAFRLELIRDDDGVEYIRWHGLEQGVPKTWNNDSHTTVSQRFGIFIMSLLPIESQL